MNYKPASTYNLLSIAVVSVLFFGTNSLAVQQSSQQLLKGGRGYIEYQLANGANEVCILPQDHILGAYKGSDRENEIKLCSKNFHSDAVQQQSGSLSTDDSADDAKPLVNKTYVTCPKLNSTNPGVLLVEIPDGWNAQQTSLSFCKPTSSIAKDVKSVYKVDAKFKQSITCSYAPSALAAYHVSRMLGNISRTPVAVVRTMNADSHLSIIKKALSILAGSTGDVIYKTWKQFFNAHSSREETKLFVDNGNLLYGALSENVTKEFIYTEVSGIGPYDTRYTRFLQQSPYKRVANSADVLQIAGNNSHYSVLMPILQQMRDVSEMVLLDTLLSQDDRIGNIHFHLLKVVLLKDEAGNQKISKEKLSAAEISEILKIIPNPSRASEATLAQTSKNLSSVLGGGVLIRSMVLKDNDCGVDIDKRSNMMRTVDAIEQVRHMDPKTYKRLLQLSQSGDEGGLKTFFTETLLYRAVDFEGGKKSFMANLKKAVEVLKENCRTGVLKLDLSDKFDPATGKWIPPALVSCEI